MESSEQMEDRRQLTSLTESSKRKYQLHVKISEEQTYSVNSVSTSSMQLGDQLVIHNQPGDDTVKRCKINFG
jgi:hypothetical protein